MAKIEQHELRIVLDPAGQPLAASATTLLDDGGYRVRPVQPGPFETPTEVLEGLCDGLDIQLRLW
jgi:hypothetical protein